MLDRTSSRNILFLSKDALNIILFSNFKYRHSRVLVVDCAIKPETGENYLQWSNLQQKKNF